MEIPDLSHLTKEEQQQILSVIKRQKDEERKEKAMIKTLHEQFENYKEQVRRASENTVESKQSPGSTNDAGQVCALCRKTKIAEGCGHTCSYCTMRFCSRCGGRVTVKSNKVMWVCNLCRKQQEMLTKTGAWYRTEQNKSGLTLSLEPIPTTELGRGKMSGSASLAQLEYRGRGTLNAKSSNNSPRLKKGLSEPHLANSEKLSDREAQKLQKETNKDLKEKTTNKETKPTTNKEKSRLPDQEVVSNDVHSRPSRGVRRSSTHSERRLYRQEQAIRQNDSSPAHTANGDKSPTNDKLINKSHNGNLPSGRTQLESSENLNSNHHKNGHTEAIAETRIPEMNASVNSDRGEILKVDSSISLTSSRSSKDVYRPRSPQASHSNNNLSANMTSTETGYHSERSSKSRHSKDYATADTTRLNAEYEHGNISPCVSEKSLHANDVRHTSNNNSVNHLPDSSKSSWVRSGHPPDSPRSLHSNHSGDTKQNQTSPNSHRTATQATVHKYSSNSSQDERSLPRTHHSQTRLDNSLSRETNHSESNFGSSPHLQRDFNQGSHSSSHSHERLPFDESNAPTSSTRKGNRRYVKNYHKTSLSDNEGSLYSNNLYASSSKHRDMGGSRRRIEMRQESIESFDSDMGGTSYPMVEFDDVTSSSSSYYQDRQLDSHLSRKVSSHYLPERSRHFITENERHLSNRFSDRNIYHSDSNMPRSVYRGSSDSLSHASDPRMDHAAHCMHYNRRRSNNNYRNGSDYLQVSALRKTYNKQKSRTGKHLRRKPSLSSTDDELQSTPDYSSCDEADKKGYTRGGNAILRKSIESGYQSSPVCHSNDKQPVSWQPSSNGKFLIGHMVLNKEAVPESGNSPKQTGGILGLKVVGGKMTEVGRLGAFITKVKRGSLADVVGHLKPGDEVIMWNNNCLQGATFDEVYEAVLASKEEKLVELMVSRPIKDVPRIPETRQHHSVIESSSSSFDSQKREDEITYRTKQQGNSQSHYQIPHLLNERSASNHPMQSLPGKLQVRIWYDQDAQQLYVTAMQAVELSTRRGGLTRNPYIKMYLLPDRSEASKRRTKTAKKTLNPTWNQSFVYGPIRRQDLGSMALELTLWDLDRSVETNNHFMGEVLIDLGLTRLDDTSQWYSLMPVGEGMNQDDDHATSSRRVVHGHRHSATMGAIPKGNRQFPHSVSQYEYDNAHGNYAASMQPKAATLGRHHREVASEANFGELYHEKMQPGYQQSAASHAPSLYHDGASSPCSSSSSIAQFSTSRNDHLSGSRRVLPSAPASNSSRSQRAEIMARVSPVSHERRRQRQTANDRVRGRHHSSDHSSIPNSSCSKDSLQVEEDYSSPHVVQHNAPSQKRTRHNSAGSHSLISRESDQSSVSREGGSRKRIESADGVENMGRTRRLSVGNGKSATLSSTRKEEALSKSISLSANLHAQNKAKIATSRKSNPSSGQSTPRSRTSSNDGKSISSNRKNNAFGKKITSMVGLKNRSQSSSNLDGNQGKNLGRSSEFGVQPQLTREGSKDSASGSLPSIASEGSSSVDKTLQDFVGGLGPGQVVGRQTLAASSLGDLELGLYERRGQLEVQVIRARNLVPKVNSKVLPAPYVKVYLMFGTQCVSKKKTKIARRTLDPAFHQTLTFDPSQYGNAVQVIIWGDYGRMDHKAFMGVVQVKVESLDLSTNSIGWYRLFPTTSLIDAASLGGNQHGSMTSLESDTASFRN